MRKKKPSVIQDKSSANGTVQPIQRLPVDQLHFDGSNPRFGGQDFEKKSEAEILDLIVKTHGVHDLLSSIAANGYLETEPLVGINEKGGVRILEGNRRLAALLILAGDLRAVNQQRLQDEYQPKIQFPIETVPVVAYEKNATPEQLLPYLGVKHIVGAKEWDSYAKAVWVARVLEQHKLKLNEIEDMIGDSQGTMKRILEGYYVVEQLKNEGRFNPRESQRKGRGSNPEYPFSWVYNALGWRVIREWVGVDGDRVPRNNPIPTANLAKAGELMVFLFGSKKRAAAISDSRQLGDLADCLADSEKAHELQKGLTVDQVRKKTQPAFDQLRDALSDADDALTSAWEAIGKGDLNEEGARSVEPRASQVKQLAAKVHSVLLNKMNGE
jgi:hypothetical protein